MREPPGCSTRQQRPHKCNLGSRTQRVTFKQKTLWYCGLWPSIHMHNHPCDIPRNLLRTPVQTRSPIPKLQTNTYVTIPKQTVPSQSSRPICEPNPNQNTRDTPLVNKLLDCPKTIKRYAMVRQDQIGPIDVEYNAVKIE